MKPHFDYLLILDFEATCWEKNNQGIPEIIEFPCVLYDLSAHTILEEFQKYVKPLDNPKLSQYCLELTGIKQEQVDDGVPLKYCLDLFKNWLSEITKKYSFSMEKNTFMKSGIFAIWSDWDLKQCLTAECKRKNIYRDLIFRRWINIRKLFISQTNFRGGLLQALRHVGLSFEGQQHCGLHDARNTARLVGLLLTRGMKLRVTSDFTHIH